MVAAWAARYVGIPWQDGGRDRDGCDCWGILRLAYREVFGIDLPSHREGYRTTADAREIRALFAAHLTPDAWRSVPLAAARPGDGLLFHVAGEPHVGVYVGEGRFLHVRAGANACVERLDGLAWARRLRAAYRHEALA